MTILLARAAVVIGAVLIFLSYIGLPWVTWIGMGLVVAGAYAWQRESIAGQRESGVDQKGSLLKIRKPFRILLAVVLVYVVTMCAFFMIVNVLGWVTGKGVAHYWP